MSKQQNIDNQAPLSAPIEDLQVRIAFLDDLVEQLNEQLVIQGLEIADLKNKCKFCINVLNLQICPMELRHLTRWLIVRHIIKFICCLRLKKL